MPKSIFNGLFRCPYCNGVCDKRQLNDAHGLKTKPKSFYTCEHCRTNKKNPYNFVMDGGRLMEYANNWRRWRGADVMF